MKKIHKFMLVGLYLLLSPINPAFADSFNVFGTYLTEEKNSHILIEDCGDGSPCGKIIWVNPESIQPGETQESIKSKSGDPILGLQILNGFERNKSDWRDGTIYDPGKDKSYASRLARLDDGSLQVKGCISFFCQTQIWTPVSPSRKEK